jgi:hypothetical protein
VAPVSRIGRIFDAVGLAVLLVGVGLLTRAWFGLRGVEAYEPTLAEGVGAAVRRVDQFVGIQRVGIAVTALAVFVFAFSWWFERRRERSE